MKFGYMGLSEPLDTTWANGRPVTVYPDGRVVYRDDGTVLRCSDNSGSVPVYNYGGGQGSQAFVLVALVAIVAIVAIAYSRR